MYKNLLSIVVFAGILSNSTAESAWHEDTLFGKVWQTNSDWNFHPVHGWIWYSNNETTSRTVYSPRWGWLWYEESFYPQTWSYDWRTWYGSEFIVSGDAWIYDHWADTWYAASDTSLDRVQRRLPSIMSHAQFCLDKSLTRLADNRSQYPDYTGFNGAYGDWLLRPATWWSAGYFPALLWLNANYTSEPEDLNSAELWTEGLFSQVGTFFFDSGLLLGLPFRRAYELTQNSSYLSGIIATCNTFDTRFSETTEAFRHWTHSFFGQDPNFTVIIDSLMNMEMMYWGSAMGGNAVWAQNAATHARTLGDVNVRENGSTYHWTIFDENDGTVLNKGTHQGYAKDSTWSRGQAWAIYGFAIAYRETGDSAFLDLAHRVTDYFLDNLPADWIPPSDFDDPLGLEVAPKDSSAAAVAASGFWILANLEPDETRKDTYMHAAGEMLLRLSHPDYLSTEIDSESILLQGSPKYADHDRGTTFGDYYFVEALLRWAGLLD